MVLSNKKLKQKLRAALLETVGKNLPSNNSDSNPTNPETPKSLKQLLDSAAYKPRLSKREKRRKALNLQSPEGLENGSNVENKVAHVDELETGKGRKRKREKKKSEDQKEGGIDGELGGKDEGGELKKEGKNRKREKLKTEDQKDGGVDGALGGKEEGGELKKEGKASKKNTKRKKKMKKKKKKGKGEKEEKQSVVENVVAVEQIVPQNVVDDRSQVNEEVNKKVYVGGIPYYSTEDDIRSYFDHCGTMTEVDCMTFPETAKFRGIAIISFKTEEAAKRALALDGSDMGGLYLKIQPYKSTRAAKTTSTDFSPPVMAGYNRIYAGNLSWDITEDDLKKLFSDCSISTIRFGEDKETGEFKGYAHVDFADHASVTKALKLDQRVVCGRPVRIRCAVPVRNVGSSAALTTSVKTETSNSTAENENSIVENENSKVENENNKNPAAVSSGKLRRRTCYECGEKGHVFSACPKKQGLEPNNPSAS